jgi:flagellin
MAEQMVEFVKNSILVQSSTAMLAQANLKPMAVLQLLNV